MTQSNARLVRGKRKKTSQMDAYDALPAIMRAAYQEGPNQFCSVYALNVYRKHKAKYGAEYVAETMAKNMMEGHAKEIAKAIPWSSDPRHPSSPHLRAGATMQLSTRPPVLAQPEPQATEPARQPALF